MTTFVNIWRLLGLYDEIMTSFFAVSLIVIDFMTIWRLFTLYVEKKNK